MGSKLVSRSQTLSARVWLRETRSKLQCIHIRIYYTISFSSSSSLTLGAHAQRGVTPSARMCQGITAVVEGRQLVYPWFYMYIQKSIERFPGVSVLLEVKAWALYCISVMRWNPAEPRRRCRSRVSIMFYLVHAHTGACIHRQATKTLSRKPPRDHSHLCFYRI